VGKPDGGCERDPVGGFAASAGSLHSRGDEVLTRAQEKAAEEKLRGTWCDGQMSLDDVEEPTTPVLGVSSESGATQGLSQDRTNISP